MISPRPRPAPIFVLSLLAALLPLLAGCGGSGPSATARTESTVPDPLGPPEGLETGVVPAPGPEAAPPLPAPGAEAVPGPAGPTAVSRELTEGGTSLRVLVEGLRRGDRVIAVILEGPDGQRATAGEQAIRTGTRMSGGRDRPRVSIRGGSDDPLGVTLMLDVFSSRPELEEESESGLAWAFLPLPDPAAYTAAPRDWRVRVLLQDAVGNRVELID